MARPRSSFSAFGIAFLLIASTMTAVVALGPSAQAAPPDIAVSKTMPATVLYGSTIPVTITASNPAAGAAPLFNASFRDVLPVGTVFVPGSPSPSLVLPNVPGLGQTTVIWNNIGDIQPGSTQSVSYSMTVIPKDTTPSSPLQAGSNVTNSASAYANSDVRFVPKFDSVNGLPTGGSTTSATTSATTKLVPIRMTKSEPSPEGELLRGVHNNATLYTLTVTNNLIAATNDVSVFDYLPAELEFLGCGGVDNTPSATPEYVGAPSLTVVPAAGPNCSTPLTVRTVFASADPTTGRPAGVYTRVEWAPTNLAAGATRTLTYRAGIPIRANGVTFPTPTPTTGAQGSNLSNNSGSLTTELVAEKAITNYASAAGTYIGVGGAVGADTTSLTRTIEDLRLQKSISAGGTTLVQGGTTTWDLDFAASEYRGTNAIVVTDTLPDGYDFNVGSATIQYVPLGGGSPVAFAPVVVTNASPTDGTQVLTWNLTNAPAPYNSAYSSNSKFKIRFTTTTRTNYRTNGQPLASFDDLTNTATVSASGTPIGAEEGSAAQPIDDVSEAGQTSSWTGVSKELHFVGDGSAVAPPASLNCGVPKNLVSGVLPSGAIARFAPDDIICYRLQVPFPTATQLRNALLTDYMPPNSSFAGQASNPLNTVTIASVLGVSGSAPLVGSTEPIRWKVGNVISGLSSDLYTGVGQRFDVTLATTLSSDPAQNNNFDLVQNLFKVTSLNSPGSATSLRSLADFRVAEPVLDLTKGVKQVNSVAFGVNKPDNGNGETTPAGRNDNANAFAGDTITYRIDVANLGATDVQDFADASTIQVVDRLPNLGSPAQTTCADLAPFPTLPLTLIRTANNGDPFAIPTDARVDPARLTQITAVTCSSGIIRWTIDYLPSGFSAEINYNLVVPTGSNAPSSGERLTNRAGVQRYQGKRSTTGLFINYYPEANIDLPAGQTANSPAANDNSRLRVPEPTIVKTVTTELNESGNNAANQVTWGENATYTVRWKIPSGVAIKVPITMTDLIPSGMEYEPGSAIMKWGTSSSTLLVPVGCVATGNDSCTFSTTASDSANPNFTLTTSGTEVKVAVATGTPTTARYTNPGGVGAADDIFEVSFKARLKSGSVSASLDNTATLAYVDGAGEAQDVSASASVSIVGPTPNIRKSHPSSPTTFKGNDVMSYTLTASNTGGSPLHDVVVSDCVPTGLTVNAGTPTSIGSIPSIAVLGATNTSAAGCTGTLITWTFLTSTAIAVGAPISMTYDVTVVGGSQTLGASESVINTAKLSGDSYPGTPTALASGDLSDKPFSATTTDTITLASPTVIKTVVQTDRVPGEIANYSVVVTIPQGLRLFDAIVIDSLPTNLEIVTGSASLASTGCTSFNPPAPTSIELSGAPIGQRHFYLGDIAASSSTASCIATITYQGKVGVGAVDRSTLQNVAALRWNSTDVLSNAITSLPSGSTFSRSLSDDATVTVHEPALTITKAVSPTGTVEAGDNVSYSIVVKNTGSATAFDIDIEDSLPPGLGVPTLVNPATAIISAGLSHTQTFAPAIVSPPTQAKLNWTLFTGTVGLAPDAAITLTYTQRVNSAVALNTASTLTNVADIVQFFADPTHGTGFETYPGPSASASVVTQVPRLAVAKTVSDGTELGQAELGAPFTWRVVATNTGTGTAYGVDLTDVLPANWSYTALTSATSSNAACAPSAGSPSVVAAGSVETVSWTNICDLPASATLTLVFTATPGAAAIPVPYTVGVRYRNTITVEGSDKGGDALTSSNDSAEATIRSSDLKIEKTDGGGTFVIGNTGRYTLTVSNLGPDSEAGPVIVTDNLPTGLVLDAAPSSLPGSGLDWLCTGAAGDISFTCTLQGVPSGGVAVNANIRSIDVPVRVLESALVATNVGSVENSANVDGTTFDNDPSNNDESEVTPIARNSDHRIAKALTDGSLNAGTDVTYSIAVTNDGPSPSTGLITATDPLPADLRLMSFAPGAGWDCSTSTLGTGYLAAPSGGNNGNLVCTRTSNLEAAGTAFPAITLVARINPASTSAQAIENVANVTAPADTNPGNDSSRETVNATPSANLTIEKTSDNLFQVGQGGTYRIAVSNAGPTNEAGPVTVTDTLPVGLRLTAVSGGASWDCSASTLGTGFASGATGNIICVHTPTLAAPLTAGTFLPQIVVTVLVGATAAPNANPLANNTITNTARVAGVTDTTDSTDDVTTDVERISTLAIVKRHNGGGTWNVGDIGKTFEIEVTNNGPSPEYGPIVVTDTLPVGLTFVSSVGTGWSCVGTTSITCTYARPVGTSVTQSIFASATSLPVITVTVDVTPSAAPLLAPATNTAVNAANVVGRTDPVLRDTIDSVIVVPLADLSIDKTHTGTLIVGQQMHFFLQVTNAGPSVAAAPITVVDDLPVGMKYISSVGGDWACSAVGQTVTCTSATNLGAASSAAPIDITVEVEPAAEIGVINNARVSSPTTDPVSGNNRDSDEVIGIPSSDLVIDKSHADPEMFVGVPGVYTLSVSNAGPSINAGPITIDDELPGFMTLTSVAGNGWDCASSTNDRVRCVRPGPVAVNEILPPISIMVSIDAAIVPAGSPDVTVINTATVASPIFDPTPTNNTDTDPTKVIAAADLTIRKSHTETVIQPGTVFDFTIQTQNRGPAPAGGAAAPLGPITVTDELPIGILFVSADGSGWTCSFVLPRLTCTHPARLLPGASWPNIIVRVQGAQVGDWVNQASIVGRTPDLVLDNNRADDLFTVLPVLLPVPPVSLPDAEKPDPTPTVPGATIPGATVPNVTGPDSTAPRPALPVGSTQPGVSAEPGVSAQSSTTNSTIAVPSSDSSRPGVSVNSGSSNSGPGADVAGSSSGKAESVRSGAGDDTKVGSEGANRLGLTGTDPMGLLVLAIALVLFGVWVTRSSRSGRNSKQD